MPKPKPILAWETVKIVAELDGATYTITKEVDDEGDDWWVVDIDHPDATGEVLGSIEEAKWYCENTVAALQAEVDG